MRTILIGLGLAVIIILLALLALLVIMRAGIPTRNAPPASSATRPA
jgi:hypothetical protein